MSNSIEPWPRPLFQPGGSANRAHLFCFASRPLSEVQLSAARFGLPDDASEALEVREIKRVLDPGWFDGFRSGSLRGIAAEALGSLAELDAADRMVVIIMNRADGPDLRALQAAWAVAKWSIARGAGVVLDAESNRFWRGAEVAEWPPQRPFMLSAELNVIVEAEPTASQAIIHTRGMAKFGRPDLIVEDVPKPRWDAVAALVRQFAGQLALGAVIEPGAAVPIEGGVARFAEGTGDPLHLNNRSLVITGSES